MKRKVIKVYFILIVLLLVAICAHIYYGHIEYETEYYTWDWYEDTDSITITLNDITNWQLADDSPVVICKYKGKDLALSCIAFQYLCYHDTCTFFKDSYHAYITIDELE